MNHGVEKERVNRILDRYNVRAYLKVLRGYGTYAEMKEQELFNEIRYLGVKVAVYQEALSKTAGEWEDLRKERVEEIKKNIKLLEKEPENEELKEQLDSSRAKFKRVAVATRLITDPYGVEKTKDALEDAKAKRKEIGNKIKEVYKNK